MQRIFSQCISQIWNHSPIAPCCFVLTHHSCVTARNSLACCDLCPVMCWFSHQKEWATLAEVATRKQEAIQLPACSFITLMWLRQGLAAPWICCKLFWFAHILLLTSIPLAWLFSLALYWQSHCIWLHKLWNINMDNVWDTIIFKTERKIIAKIENYLHFFNFLMKWLLVSEESPISKSVTKSTFF